MGLSGVKHCFRPGIATGLYEQKRTVAGNGPKRADAGQIRCGNGRKSRAGQLTQDRGGRRAAFNADGRYFTHSYNVGGNFRQTHR